MITETWLKDGAELDADLRDLELGAGLSTLTRNRQPHPTTGVCHGGVAVIYKKKMGNFKKIDFQNPEQYEILPVIGSVTGSSRNCLLYTSPSPRDRQKSRMPSSA